MLSGVCVVCGLVCVGSLHVCLSSLTHAWALALLLVGDLLASCKNKLSGCTCCVVLCCVVLCCVVLCCVVLCCVVLCCVVVLCCPVCVKDSFNSNDDDRSFS